MSKGVLVFCFDTPDTGYHKILERCVRLVKKNLGVEITVVTNFETFKKMKPMGFINYKFIEPETGNRLLGKEWNNVDRHMAYDLSPYDTTLVLDIDYFCFTDNLAECFDTEYDFLIPDRAHDVTGKNAFDLRKWSLIPMVWATVILFRKTTKAKQIFDTVKYVKQYYPYFIDMYRISSRNFRNDYAFAIALQQINGFLGYEKLPFSIATLPRHCKILEVSDTGITWSINGAVGGVENQDLHVLNKEIADV